MVEYHGHCHKCGCDVTNANYGRLDIIEYDIGEGLDEDDFHMVDEIWHYYCLSCSQVLVEAIQCDPEFLEKENVK